MFFYRRLILVTFLFACCVAAGDTIVPVSGRVSDLEARMALADTHAAMGHAGACRDMYTKLLDGESVNDELLIKYADTCIMWGNFYSAETVYRNYLKKFPESDDVRLKLAGVLGASQQYEYAGHECLEMLRDKPGDTRVLYLAADLKSREGDYEAALNHLEGLLSKDPRHADALFLKGQLLLKLGQFDEAKEIFVALDRIEPKSARAKTGMGRILLARRDYEGAQQVLADALVLEPGSMKASFYSHLARNKGKCPMTGSVGPVAGPRDMLELAYLFQSHGCRERALELFELAVKKDEQFFPARIGLAQALAVNRQFDGSVTLYSRLNEEFPGNFKILIEWSRVLAWARKYSESLELYAELAELNRKHPVPVREMARTSAWAKDMKNAMRLYGFLYEVPVDISLATYLKPVIDRYTGDAVGLVVEKINEYIDTGVPYDGYEWLAAEIREQADKMDQSFVAELQKVLNHLEAEYAIQRGACLESMEKGRSWNRQYLRSRRLCVNLLETWPGNQEVIYDLAQVELALEMGKEASETIDRLLVIDPTHSQALLVRRKLDVIENFFAGAGFSYWHEEGRGDLSDITSLRYDISAGLPVYGRSQFRAGLISWHENAGNPDDDFSASGFFFDGRAVFFPWLRASAGLTIKNYSDSGIDDFLSGYVDTTVNFFDFVRVSLAHERSDELYNSSGIMQGVQTDALRLLVSGYIKRDLEIFGYGRLVEYTDDNSAEHAYINIAYSASDHPRVFKAAVFAEVRDTDELTTFAAEGEASAPIVHPYWTPENYSAWGFIADWQHDLSPVLSRGTDSRFYNISLTLRDDTENNEAVELKGRLRWQTRLRWAAGVDAVVARSRDWDAEGLWLTLSRHF